MTQPLLQAPIVDGTALVDHDLALLVNFTLDSLWKSDAKGVPTRQARRAREDLIGVGGWAHKTFWVMPRFAERGVDCDVLQRVLDWTKAAWPKVDWNQFRPMVRATVPLRLVKNVAKGPFLEAVASNAGNAPVFSWQVNGTSVPNSGSVLPLVDVPAGASIQVTLTSNSSCLTMNAPTAHRTAVGIAQR
ncbi:MAG: hypothetical protein RJA70_3422 [Pseudomonadota bacterium]|jgi:hypothetical protein